MPATLANYYARTGRLLGAKHASEKLGPKFPDWVEYMEGYSRG